jgi:hypothetical protein
MTENPTLKPACPHCGNVDNGYTVRVPAVLVYVGIFNKPDSAECSSTDRDRDPTMGRCNSCHRLFKL